VAHKSVCDCGSREERLVIMAAERQPVMISDQISTRGIFTVMRGIRERLSAAK
jgi:hypothetical protein